MPDPQRLSGLRQEAYEHPGDAAALRVLTKTAGLDILVRKLNSWGFERLLRVQLTGSHLRVTPNSFPDLHALLMTACETLDFSRPPDLYIGGSEELQTFTAGVEDPLILLHSGSVESLTPEELLFVISHQIGHIRSKHLLYYQIAEFLPLVAEIVGTATLGIGELLGAGLEIALLQWKRMSKLTADRAGLLGCQDLDVALRTLMKLAGLPHKYFQTAKTQDFIQQAKEFKAMDADKLSLLAKWLSTMGRDHPWTVMRAHQLLQWVERGDYAEVLKAPGRIQIPLPPGVVGYCVSCGFGLRAGDVYCPVCGHRVAQASAANQ
jgi:Zn-dependent protease with chaperone function